MARTGIPLFKTRLIPPNKYSNPLKNIRRDTVIPEPKLSTWQKLKKLLTTITTKI